jgi:hypothetical protein
VYYDKEYLTRLSEKGEIHQIPYQSQTPWSGNLREVNKYSSPKIKHYYWI